MSDTSNVIEAIEVGQQNLPQLADQISQVAPGTDLMEQLGDVEIDQEKPVSKLDIPVKAAIATAGNDAIPAETRGEEVKSIMYDARKEHQAERNPQGPEDELGVEELEFELEQGAESDYQHLLSDVPSLLTKGKNNPVLFDISYSVQQMFGNRTMFNEPVYAALEKGDYAAVASKVKEKDPQSPLLVDLERMSRGVGSFLSSASKAKLSKDFKKGLEQNEGNWVNDVNTVPAEDLADLVSTVKQEGFSALSNDVWVLLSESPELYSYISESSGKSNSDLEGDFKSISGIPKGLEHFSEGLINGFTATLGMGLEAVDTANDAYNLNTSRDALGGLSYSQYFNKFAESNFEDRDEKKMAGYLINQALRGNHASVDHLYRAVFQKWANTPRELVKTMHRKEMREMVSMALNFEKDGKTVASHLAKGLSKPVFHVNPDELQSSLDHIASIGGQAIGSMLPFMGVGIGTNLAVRGTAFTLGKAYHGASKLGMSVSEYALASQFPRVLYAGKGGHAVGKGAIGSGSGMVKSGLPLNVSSIASATSLTATGGFGSAVHIGEAVQRTDGALASGADTKDHIALAGIILGPSELVPISRYLSGGKYGPKWLSHDPITMTLKDGTRIRSFADFSKSPLLRKIMRKIHSGVQGAVEETLQESITNFAHNVMEAGYNPKIALMDGMVHSALGGSLAGGFMGLVMPGGRFRNFELDRKEMAKFISKDGTPISDEVLDEIDNTINKHLNSVSHIFNMEDSEKAAQEVQFVMRELASDIAGRVENKDSANFLYQSIMNASKIVEQKGKHSDHVKSGGQGLDVSQKSLLEASLVLYAIVSADPSVTNVDDLIDAVGSSFNLTDLHKYQQSTIPKTIQEFIKSEKYEGYLTQAGFAFGKDRDPDNMKLAVKAYQDLIADSEAGKFINVSPEELVNTFELLMFQMATAENVRGSVKRAADSGIEGRQGVLDFDREPPSTDLTTEDYTTPQDREFIDVVSENEVAADGENGPIVLLGAEQPEQPGKDSSDTPPTSASVPNGEGGEILLLPSGKVPLLPYYKDEEKSEDEEEKPVIVEEEEEEEEPVIVEEEEEEEKPEDSDTNKPEDTPDTSGSPPPPSPPSPGTIEVEDTTSKPSTPEPKVEEPKVEEPSAPEPKAEEPKKKEPTKKAPAKKEHKGIWRGALSAPKGTKPKDTSTPTGSTTVDEDKLDTSGSRTVRAADTKRNSAGKAARALEEALNTPYSFVARVSNVFKSIIGTGTEKNKEFMVDVSDDISSRSENSWGGMAKAAIGSTLSGFNVSGIEDDGKLTRGNLKLTPFKKDDRKLYSTANAKPGVEAKTDYPIHSAANRAIGTDAVVSKVAQSLVPLKFLFTDAKYSEEDAEIFKKYYAPKLFVEVLTRQLAVQGQDGSLPNISPILNIESSGTALDRAYLVFEGVNIEIINRAVQDVAVNLGSQPFSIKGDLDSDELGDSLNSIIPANSRAHKALSSFDFTNLPKTKVKLDAVISKIDGLFAEGTSLRGSVGATGHSSYAAMRHLRDSLSDSDFVSIIESMSDEIIELLNGENREEAVKLLSDSFVPSTSLNTINKIPELFKDKGLKEEQREPDDEDGHKSGSEGSLISVNLEVSGKGNDGALFSLIDSAGLSKEDMKASVERALGQNRDGSSVDAHMFFDAIAGIANQAFGLKGVEDARSALSTILQNPTGIQDIVDDVENGDKVIDFTSLHQLSHSATNRLHWVEKGTAALLWQVADNKAHEDHQQIQTSTATEVYSKYLPPKNAKGKFMDERGNPIPRPKGIPTQDMASALDKTANGRVIESFNKNTVPSVQAIAYQALREVFKENDFTQRGNERTGILKNLIEKRLESINPESDPIKQGKSIREFVLSALNTEGDFKEFISNEISDESYDEGSPFLVGENRTPGVGGRVGRRDISRQLSDENLSEDTGIRSTDTYIPKGLTDSVFSTDDEAPAPLASMGEDRMSEITLRRRQLSTSAEVGSEEYERQASRARMGSGIPPTMGVTGRMMRVALQLGREVGADGQLLNMEPHPMDEEVYQVPINYWDAPQGAKDGELQSLNADVLRLLRDIETTPQFTDIIEPRTEMDGDLAVRELRVARLSIFPLLRRMDIEGKSFLGEGEGIEEYGYSSGIAFDYSNKTGYEGSRATSVIGGLVDVFLPNERHPGGFYIRKALMNMAYLASRSNITFDDLSAQVQDLLATVYPEASNEEMIENLRDGYKLYLAFSSLQIQTGRNSADPEGRPIRREPYTSAGYPAFFRYEYNHSLKEYFQRNGHALKFEVGDENLSNTEFFKKHLNGDAGIAFAMLEGAGVTAGLSRSNGHEDALTLLSNPTEFGGVGKNLSPYGKEEGSTTAGPRDTVPNAKKKEAVQRVIDFYNALQVSQTEDMLPMLKSLEEDYPPLFEALDMDAEGLVQELSKDEGRDYESSVLLNEKYKASFRSVYEEAMNDPKSNKSPIKAADPATMKLLYDYFHSNGDLSTESIKEFAMNSMRDNPIYSSIFYGSQSVDDKKSVDTRKILGARYSEQSVEAIYEGLTPAGQFVFDKIVEDITKTLNALINDRFLASPFVSEEAYEVARGIATHRELRGERSRPEGQDVFNPARASMPSTSPEVMGANELSPYSYTKVMKGTEGKSKVSSYDANKFSRMAFFDAPRGGLPSKKAWDLVEHGFSGGMTVNADGHTSPNEITDSLTSSDNSTAFGSATRNARGHYRSSEELLYQVHARDVSQEASRDKWDKTENIFYNERANVKQDALPAGKKSATNAEAGRFIFQVEELKDLFRMEGKKIVANKTRGWIDRYLSELMGFRVVVAKSELHLKDAELAGIIFRLYYGRKYMIEYAQQELGASVAEAYRFATVGIASLTSPSGRSAIAYYTGKEQDASVIPPYWIAQLQTLHPANEMFSDEEIAYLNTLDIEGLRSVLRTQSLLESSAGGSDVFLEEGSYPLPSSYNESLYNNFGGEVATLPALWGADGLIAKVKKASGEFLMASGEFTQEQVDDEIYEISEGFADNSNAILGKRKGFVLNSLMKAFVKEGGIGRVTRETLDSLDAKPMDSQATNMSYGVLATSHDKISIKKANLDYSNPEKNHTSGRGNVGALAHELAHFLYFSSGYDMSSSPDKVHEDSRPRLNYDSPSSYSLKHINVPHISESNPTSLSPRDVTFTKEDGATVGSSEVGAEAFAELLLKRTSDLVDTKNKLSAEEIKKIEEEGETKASRNLEYSLLAAKQNTYFDKVSLGASGFIGPKALTYISVIINKLSRGSSYFDATSTTTRNTPWASVGGSIRMGRELELSGIHVDSRTGAYSPKSKNFNPTAKWIELRPRVEGVFSLAKHTDKVKEQVEMFREIKAYYLRATIPFRGAIEDTSSLMLSANQAAALEFPLYVYHMQKETGKSFMELMEDIGLAKELNRRELLSMYAPATHILSSAVAQSYTNGTSDDSTLQANLELIEAILHDPFEGDGHQMDMPLDGLTGSDFTLVSNYNQGNRSRLKSIRDEIKDAKESIKVQNILWDKFRQKARGEGEVEQSLDSIIFALQAAYDPNTRLGSPSGRGTLPIHGGNFTGATVMTQGSSEQGREQLGYYTSPTEMNSRLHERFFSEFMEKKVAEEQAKGEVEGNMAEAAGDYWVTPVEYMKNWGVYFNEMFNEDSRWVNSAQTKYYKEMHKLSTMADMEYLRLRSEGYDAASDEGGTEGFIALDNEIRDRIAELKQEYTQAVAAEMMMPSPEKSRPREDFGYIRVEHYPEDEDREDHLVLPVPPEEKKSRGGYRPPKEPGAAPTQRAVRAIPSVGAVDPEAEEEPIDFQQISDGIKEYLEAVRGSLSVTSNEVISEEDRKVITAHAEETIARLVEVDEILANDKDDLNARRFEKPLLDLFNGLKVWTEDDPSGMSPEQVAGIASMLVSLFVDENPVFTLADGMGVGKTLQYMAAAKSSLDNIPAVSTDENGYAQGNGVVVIAPGGVISDLTSPSNDKFELTYLNLVEEVDGKYEWKKEYRDRIQFITYDNLSMYGQHLSGKDIVTTHEWFQKLNGTAARMVVADEAHYLKNIGGATGGNFTTQAFTKLLTDGVETHGATPKVIYVTGTPVTDKSQVEWTARIATSNLKRVRDAEADGTVQQVVNEITGLGLNDPNNPNQQNKVNNLNVETIASYLQSTIAISARQGDTLRRYLPAMATSEQKVVWLDGIDPASIIPQIKAMPEGAEKEELIARARRVSQAHKMFLYAISHIKHDATNDLNAKQTNVRTEDGYESLNITSFEIFNEVEDMFSTDQIKEFRDDYANILNSIQDRDGNFDTTTEIVNGQEVVTSAPGQVFLSIIEALDDVYGRFKTNGPEDKNDTISEFQKYLAYRISAFSAVDAILDRKDSGRNEKTIVWLGDQNVAQDLTVSVNFRSKVIESDNPLVSETFKDLYDIPMDLDGGVNLQGVVPTSTEHGLVFNTQHTRGSGVNATTLEVTSLPTYSSLIYRLVQAAGLRVGIASSAREKRPNQVHDWVPTLPKVEIRERFQREERTEYPAGKDPGGELDVAILSVNTFSEGISLDARDVQDKRRTAIFLFPAAKTEKLVQAMFRQSRARTTATRSHIIFVTPMESIAAMGQLNRENERVSIMNALSELAPRNMSPADTLMKTLENIQGKAEENLEALSEQAKALALRNMKGAFKALPFQKGIDIKVAKRKLTPSQVMHKVLDQLNIQTKSKHELVTELGFDINELADVPYVFDNAMDRQGNSIVKTAYIVADNISVARAMNDLNPFLMRRMFAFVLGYTGLTVNPTDSYEQILDQMSQVMYKTSALIDIEAEEYGGTLSADDFRGVVSTMHRWISSMVSPSDSSTDATRRMSPGDGNSQLHLSLVAMAKWMFGAVARENVTGYNLREIIEGGSVNRIVLELAKESPYTGEAGGITLDESGDFGNVSALAKSLEAVTDKKVRLLEALNSLNKDSALVPETMRQADNVKVISNTTSGSRQPIGTASVIVSNTLAADYVEATIDEVRVNIIPSSYGALARIEFKPSGSEEDNIKQKEAFDKSETIRSFRDSNIFDDLSADAIVEDITHYSESTASLSMSEFLSFFHAIKDKYEARDIGAVSVFHDANHYGTNISGNAMQLSGSYYYFEHAMEPGKFVLLGDLQSRYKADDRYLVRALDLVEKEGATKVEVLYRRPLPSGIKDVTEGLVTRVADTERNVVSYEFSEDIPEALNQVKCSLSRRLKLNA